MKILVTGGAGFIGSWLVESLVRNGHVVAVVDNLSPQVHGHVPQPTVQWLREATPGVRFVRGDVRDSALMDSLLADAEALIHLAAETGTGQSMYQISHYNEVNQQATAILFESIATRHRHLRKVVLASSRSVYGEGAYRDGSGKVLVPAPRDVKRLALGEFEPLGHQGERLSLIATPEDVTPYPASIYAATKLANEALGRICADAYGLQVTALRFQNVYGERQSLRNPYTGILSIFSNRMRQGLPINIFEDGQESRDFVHVTDIIRAIELALFRESEGFLVANVGAGIPTTVLQVAHELKRLLNSDSELIVSGDFRAGDIRHCYADLSRARELLGFSPVVELTEGLSRFVDWVLTQDVLEDQSQKAQSELAVLGLGRVAG